MHEAQCQMSCPEFSHLHEFQVTLEFEGLGLIDGFTLVTNSTLENFEEFLKTAKNLPDIWSVEMLSEKLFEEASKFVNTLKKVSIFSTDEPYKIGSYTGETKIIAVQELIEEIE